MEKIYLYLRFLTNKNVATKIIIYAFPKKIFPAAIRSNNFYIIKSIVETGFIYDFGDTSIFCAFKNNYDDLIYYLFKNNLYPPDCRLSYVKWAAKNDKLDVFEHFEVDEEDKIKVIIRYGRVNFLERNWPNDYSPTCFLKDAVIERQLDLVKYLIKKGADPNSEDVLEIAVINNDLDIIKVLNANLRKYNDLPLQLAAEFGHIVIVKYLIENGADPTSENNTAVGLAFENNFIEIVNFLIQKGGQIPSKTSVLNVNDREKRKKIIYFQSFKRSRRYF